MQTITVTNSNTITLPDFGQRMTIEQIVDVVKRSGSHFFDRDTMRFFKSRVDDVTFTGPDGWYFVTSEKHESAFAGINEPRRYTVRCLTLYRTSDGSDVRLYELGGFQAYTTLTRARTAARNAAKSPMHICPDCSLRLLRHDWRGIHEVEERCPDCARYAERKAAGVR